jgi:hypothetical protein
VLGAAAEARRSLGKRLMPPEQKQKQKKGASKKMPLSLKKKT